MIRKSIEVLVATMNRANTNFLEDMNLSTDVVVVNQNDSVEEITKFDELNKKVTLINSIDKGLSNSRNLALKYATADICLIADDDMIYHSDYKDKIIQAYEQYPDADIIAFQVKRIGNPEREKKFRKNLNWENYLTSMKISSVEITFKRKTIIDKKLSFNPNVGAGTEFYNGEENIFLYDALRKNCKVLYLPIEIAEVDMSDSSWFEGYTKSFFETVGAKFYNMTKKYYYFLIVQYAIRKYPYYKENFSFAEAFKQMKFGVKKYKEKYNQNIN